MTREKALKIADNIDCDLTRETATELVEEIFEDEIEYVKYGTCKNCEKYTQEYRICTHIDSPLHSTHVNRNFGCILFTN